MTTLDVVSYTQSSGPFSVPVLPKLEGKDFWRLSCFHNLIQTFNFTLFKTLRGADILVGRFAQGRSTQKRQERTFRTWMFRSWAAMPARLSFHCSHRPRLRLRPFLTTKLKPSQSARKTAAQRLSRPRLARCGLLTLGMGLEAQIKLQAMERSSCKHLKGWQLLWSSCISETGSLQ